MSSFDEFDCQEEDETLQIEAKRAIAYLQGHRNYRYVTFLAQGGYGWVSLVYDDHEKRALAVKCTQDTSEMELSWWPKLHHPNILSLLEYITLDSCTVFVMPAMRKDLWMCISEEQFYKDELSFGLCRIWLRDVATGLNYLHKQYLCHLDLKLDNVFLKEDGHVCLGDFSLLSDTREVPEGFHFLEMYEPPEYSDWCHGIPPSTISAGEKFGGDKADMWQFGILTIDLLTDFKLTNSKSSYFSMFQHDVWPFIQKVLLHQEYLEYLLESTFQKVVFNDVDFDFCHDFVHKILCLEPNERINAEVAKDHEFVSIDWPQLPSIFSVPKEIVVHQIEKPLPIEETKHDEDITEAELGKERTVSSTSKGAIDVLKRKMKKLKNEKLVIRESIAAEAGKRPAKIKANMSVMHQELDKNIMREEKTTEYNSKQQPMFKTRKIKHQPSTLANNRKLVAKVTDSKKQKSNQSSKSQSTSRKKKNPKEKKKDSKRNKKTDKNHVTQEKNKIKYEEKKTDGVHVPRNNKNPHLRKNVNKSENQNLVLNSPTKEVKEKKNLSDQMIKNKFPISSKVGDRSQSLNAAKSTPTKLKTSNLGTSSSRIRNSTSTTRRWVP